MIIRLNDSTNRPVKVFVVVAYTEECNFVARVFRYKCEARQFCRIGDGNPYVTSYGIEEVMLY